jgi:hypothetical protein
VSTGTNPFAGADAWETSTGEYLGVGNHRVRIDQADDASSQQGKPQIALIFRNDEGMKSDWCNYSSEFLSKVVALFDAAGIERPQVGEFDPQDNCRLTEACRKRLLGREVGIVVRLEDDYKDPTKQVPRVAGYVPASRIDGGADTRGLPPAQQQQPQKSSAPAQSPATADDRIPF